MNYVIDPHAPRKTVRVAVYDNDLLLGEVDLDVLDLAGFGRAIVRLDRYYIAPLESLDEQPPTLAQEIASIINSAHAEAPDEPIVEVMRVGDCYRARYVREERALPQALAEIERLRAENAALRGWERTGSYTEPSKPRSAT